MIPANWQNSANRRLPRRPQPTPKTPPQDTTLVVLSFDDSTASYQGLFDHSKETLEDAVQRITARWKRLHGVTLEHLHVIGSYRVTTPAHYSRVVHLAHVNAENVPAHFDQSQHLIKDSPAFVQ